MIQPGRAEYRLPRLALPLEDDERLSHASRFVRRSHVAPSRRRAARPRPAARAHERGADELAEERRRARRARLELRVELARDEPRVIRQLDDLDEPALLERAGDDEAGSTSRGR